MVTEFLACSLARYAQAAKAARRRSSSNDTGPIKFRARPFSAVFAPLREVILPSSNKTVMRIVPVLS